MIDQNEGSIFANEARNCLFLSLWDFCLSDQVVLDYEKYAGKSDGASQA